MKARIFLLFAPLVCSTQLFAQIRPMAEKTVVPVQGTQTLRHVEEVKKPAPPPAPPTNIQSVLLDIQNGDDGKEAHTAVTYDFEDNNHRDAANYCDGPTTTTTIVGMHFKSGPPDEYLAGTSISVPLPTLTSVPTGQTTKVGSLILPVTRLATVADFSNGGELKISLAPTSNGHNDIWKIQTVTAKITFENDPHSPHIIRWSNIVLTSQTAPVRELFFDANYKPL